MYSKYTLLLTMLLLMVACNEDADTIDYDGSTSLDDEVDYSTFKAVISDSFVERTISTKASLSTHIGFASNATPDLAVMFDDGTSVAYEYDIESEYYNATEQTTAKAQYIYSTNSDVSGAIVAATWPSEFSLHPDNSIELKNRKSRMQISYKYNTSLNSQKIVVNDIYIGKIYTQGGFDATNELIYKIDTSIDPADLYTEQVNSDADILSDEESTDDYQVASYEAFVIPQNIDEYSTYIKFDLMVDNESETYIYYLPNTFYVEPFTLYKLLFEVEFVDEAISFDLERQSEIAEWEDGDDLSITVNPYQPLWSVWDGSSTELYTKGSGVEGDPYLIENANQLAYLSKLTKAGTAYTEAMASYFLLTANVDMSAGSWTPIGSSSYPFTGVFDGGQYIIKGATNIFDANNNGFICYMGTSSAEVAAVIKNVTITNASFTIATISSTSTYKQTGGIVGYVSSNSTGVFHTIENCKVLNSTISSGYYAGGVVGYGVCNIIGCTVENTDISTCSAYTSTGACGVGSIVGAVVGNKAISISHNLSSGNSISGLYGASMGGVIGYVSTTNVASLDASSNYLCDLTYTAADGEDVYGIAPPNSSGTLATRTYSYHNIVMEDGVGDYDCYTDAVGTTLADLLNGSGSITFEEGDLYWIADDEASTPTPAYYTTTTNN